jgi:hypothetical protein
MDIFCFPTEKDGRHAIEVKYCELLNEYRNGAKLAPEIIDWMDSANNWLMVSDSRKRK